MSNDAATNMIRVWDVVETMDNNLRPARDKIELARNMMNDAEVLNDFRDGFLRIMTEAVDAFDLTYQEISGRRGASADMPLVETRSGTASAEAGNHPKPMTICQILNLLDERLKPEREKWEVVSSAVLSSDFYEDALPGIARVMFESAIAYEEVYRQIHEAYKLDRELNPPKPPATLGDIPPWLKKPEAEPESAGFPADDSATMRKALNDHLGAEIDQLRLIRESLPGLEIRPVEMKDFEDPLRIQTEIQRIVGDVIQAFDRWNSSLYPDDFEGDE